MSIFDYILLKISLMHINKILHIPKVIIQNKPFNKKITVLNIITHVCYSWEEVRRGGLGWEEGFWTRAPVNPGCKYLYMYDKKQQYVFTVSPVGIHVAQIWSGEGRCLGKIGIYATVQEQWLEYLLCNQKVNCVFEPHFVYGCVKEHILDILNIYNENI